MDHPPSTMEPDKPPSLLPAPIASAVSLVTKSSSLYLQLSTFIGGLALDGARITTLTGLELSRALIESILIRSGRDISSRSTEIGRAEADGILESTIAILHRTISSISFATNTGFYFSSTALYSATDLSQQLLSTLDSILGSTDSSRAIASIITLIRREFQNPATGRKDEKVGVSDLLLGICGLALLQKWTKKLDETKGEIIWDMVILNDGRRVDVREITDNATRVDAKNMELARITAEEGIEDSEDLEVDLKQRIMESLPTDASVSITSSTTTTKTITIETTGVQPPDIFPLPGFEIVEEEAHHTCEVDLDADVLTNGQKIGRLVPRYRVVLRNVRNELHGTDIETIGVTVEDEDTRPRFTISPLSSDSEVPPKLPRHPSKSESKPLPKPPQNETERSSPSHSAKHPENVANQKRSRKPISTSSSVSGSDHNPLNTKPPSKKTKPSTKPSEKKGSFRSALRKGSTSTLSNLWNKDHETFTKSSQKPPWGVPTKSNPPLPERSIPQRDAPPPPQRRNGNSSSPKDLGVDIPRSPSRTSYYSIHERRDSIVSQSETYSIHAAESRPRSPTAFKTHLRADSNLLGARSEKNIESQSTKHTSQSPTKHRRSKSHVPSIYTLATNSVTSLVLAPRRSAFEHSDTLDTLARTGTMDGLFPQHHLVRNITRFVRFASASYGASFLRIMGITNYKSEINTTYHHEHHSFSSHTKLPTDTILVSSFVDPSGGTDSSGNTNTSVPMVHFVTLDHDSKAVVLTCRGTLGFEDVLTDMTCDYDALSWRGGNYSVHKGIHASARRLLDGGGGRVMATIAAALEEFPDYGLVMCGHSLGGGVTALLAILISEPSTDPSSTSFITSSYSTPRFLTASEVGTAPLRLPSGRPIHVYAYGPPATISPSLRLATLGLITTIVNGQDLVPYLSLGVLHDLQAVALAFKTDESGARAEVMNRFWAGITGTFKDKWYQGEGSTVGPGIGMEEDDQWAYSTLKALRAAMLSSKLVPPGEVFIVESSPVLKRDAFVKTDGSLDRDSGLGRPATRAVLKYVKDVEKKFGEVKFRGSMLLDHSPGRYESSLGALGEGVFGTF